jgi:hypothetical protein
MFPHHKIYKYTRTSPEGNTTRLITFLWIEDGHSSILDVRSFRGEDCDTNNYLVVAKVRGRLAVSKRAAQKIDMERFNVKNLSGGGGGVLNNSIRLHSKTFAAH